MPRSRRRRGIARILAVAAAAVIVSLIAVLVWRELRARNQSVQPIVESLPPAKDGLALPKRRGSLRFAVMGDTGRGDRAQYDTANEMARWRSVFDYNFVIMLGDNIYAEGTAAEYAARFERPYKILIDSGVKFYAALGNHDPPGQHNYPLFNMNGNRYYTFEMEEGALQPVAPRRVRFFAIDTVTLDPPQLAWLRRELGTSGAEWKICFFHHPIYTSGRYQFSAIRLRNVLEPIFTQFGVDVAMAGHEHFYERIIPQNGVLYFTSGAGGALRVNDIRSSDWTAAGFDDDNHFMLMEIADDTLYFQAISRTGQTVDSGSFKRIPEPTPPPAIRR